MSEERDEQLEASISGQEEDRPPRKKACHSGFSRLLELRLSFEFATIV